MAIYRQIYMSFWTDPKVDDDFTPEDKYFYLYLLTNPHTNICGCYEVGMKQMERETGYNKDTVMRLINRMEQVHDVLRYDPNTKELLLLNWHKHNWTRSDKLLKNVVSTSQHIKSDAFREYVLSLVEGEGDTVSIPYRYPMDTSVTVTVSDTVTDSDSISVPVKKSSSKPVRHKYGMYQNVLLSDEDYQKLQEEFPHDYSDRIERLSEYMASTGKKYKNHPATIRAWARRENNQKKEKSSNPFLDMLQEGE